MGSLSKILLVLAFALVACGSKFDKRLKLEDMQVEGNSKVHVVTKHRKLLEALDWIEENIPEITKGVPHNPTAMWVVIPAVLESRYYAVADPTTRTIKFNKVSLTYATIEDVKSILIHELIHAKLFEQGVYSSSQCARVYHEVLAYTTELNNSHKVDASLDLRTSNWFNYNNYKYEYEARYCHMWFADLPELKVKRTNYPRPPPQSLNPPD